MITKAYQKSVLTESIAFQVLDSSLLDIEDKNAKKKKKEKDMTWTGIEPAALRWHGILESKALPLSHHIILMFFEN